MITFDNLLQEIDSKPAAEEKISVDVEGDESGKEEKTDGEEAASTDAEKKGKAKRSEGPKHERTFLTFSDHDTFRQAFPHKRPKVPQQKICPITRLPAKYFDPVTRLPYANLQAFKFLRGHYYNQLDAKGNRDDPEVAEWIAWRNKNKHLQQQLQQQQQQQQQHAPAHVGRGAAAAFAPLLARSTSLPQQQQVTLPSHPSPQVQQQQATNMPTLAGVLRATPSLPAQSPAAAALTAVQSPVAATLGQQQQQSVVLPVRTTPLGATAPVQAASSFVAASPALPTQPSAAVAQTMQTVRIAGAGQVNRKCQLSRTFGASQQIVFLRRYSSLGL